jgi:hypothetical protein
VLDRVRYREYDSVLDREGVSVVERTRQLVCQYRHLSEYKRVLHVIKKHVGRHSV